MVGTVIAIPRTARAAGAFQSWYATQVIAIRKIPSPMRDTVIPSQRRRKSRERRGRRSPTRANPPGRSSPSKLCCCTGRACLVGDQIVDEVIE